MLSEILSHGEQRVSVMLLSLGANWNPKILGVWKHGDAKTPAPSAVPCPVVAIEDCLYVYTYNGIPTMIESYKLHAG